MSRGLGRALLWHWLPVALWMAVIITLSSQSTLPKRNDPVTGDPIPQMYPVAKAWHVFEYSVLSLLLFRALYSPAGGVGFSPVRAALAATAAAAAFGGVDELRQSFVPRREASPVDVLIDATAAALAALLALGWLRLWGQRVRVPPPPPPAGSMISDFGRQPRS